MSKITKLLIGLFLVVGISACSVTDTKVISEAEAQDFALQDAGIDSKDASVSLVKFDKEDKEYEVKFTSANIEYDYTIDAVHGDVLEKESEMLPIKEGEVQNLEEEFTQKALEHFAFTKDQVLNIRVEKDFDDGRENYDVSFYKDNIKYSCEFDATTKALISSETDND